ncbi:hypothetical protein PV729_04355 [Streptomyces europaeiscabiei]|uniref:Uncharacterized protein n=1 Tax=Streptomyces europaeiscabiei TaxID=146819 RepID=A0ABU4N6P1_9ACTN|nr:hypothetical protein [Streptomyces europaeiscabiei]MDX3551010.1 hypothetical protein [Streptomyces europaeiscabiei]MDX3698430.1 hypothetical protein [Streptomyces europaeiscabiei]
MSALRKLIDVDGLTWEEQPDGSFRSWDADLGYHTEPSYESLDLWSGPLREKPQA